MFCFKAVTTIICLICCTGCFRVEEQPTSEPAIESVHHESRHIDFSVEGKAIAERLETFISNALANRPNPSLVAKNEGFFSTAETANVTRLENFIVNSITDFNASVIIPFP